MNDIQRRITELTDILNDANFKYYVLDDPEMEDAQYDKLLRELEDLEKQYPQYASPDSPTMRVGGEAVNKFAKVPHKVQMGSLRDVFSLQELESFIKKIKEDLPSAEFVVEPKVDGLSVSLEYENGVFVRGATRGDGFVGEDVTLNLKTIKSIPQKLSEKVNITVRGEVFMPKAVFAQLASEQEEAGERAFKNARNAAAGSLRQKDPKITTKRKLDICVFNVQQIASPLETHLGSLEYMKKLGFKTIPDYKVCKDYPSIAHEVELIAKNRAKFDFDIDGAVIKLNSIADREVLGATSKTPRWAVAFKYPPEEKETTLLDIELNVGRTGAITPVAVFEPLILAGTEVSRAVLHNRKQIEEKDIRVGDTILVRKAGDIIPEIVASVKHAENSKQFKMPEKCPSCEKDVTFDEIAAYCTNANCPAQLHRRITHFASKNAMNIDGLGESIVNRLIYSGFVSAPSDLYGLVDEQLESIEGFGMKSARNLINSIQDSKANPLHRLIFALGIRHIGQNAATLLAERFSNIDELLNATVADIAEIEGFGEIMAQSVVSELADEKMRSEIEKLRKYGVNITSDKTEKGTTLSGLTFVITGTLPTLKREEAAALVTQSGGKVSSSVSKNTNYLLAGEKAGSKLDKATELGVVVIDEEAFKKMIEV